MPKLDGATAFFGLVIAFAAAQIAAAADAVAAHPGKAVYDRACAACHDNPGVTRAPAFEALKGMRYGTLHYALTEGKMQTQAAALSVTERAALMDYLVGRNVTDDRWVEKMMCSAERGAMSLDGVPAVAGFGFDRENDRHLTRGQAGLSTRDFEHLEL